VGLGLEQGRLVIGLRSLTNIIESALVAVAIRGELVFLLLTGHFGARWQLGHDGVLGAQ